MTKSAKKKKEKNADFTKRKLKLGKGKQAATNAVDTSFKARSIALPQQSITVTNETRAPTTKRKLTLDALLTQLKHYGAGVRKDALQGLQELLGEHPVLIERNLSKLVNSCVRLISDEDALVRRALHSFLAWLLPRVSREHLLPHAPALLLFTASAQSHIFLEIRLDAIRLLDLLLEFIPDQVVAGFWSNGAVGDRLGHGRKFLDGYLGLLNVGVRLSESESNGGGTAPRIEGQSMTLMTLSSTAKALVLTSFSNFLQYAIEPLSQEHLIQLRSRSRMAMPLWCLSDSFSSHEAFKCFANVLSLQRSSESSWDDTRVWIEENDLGEYTGMFKMAGVLENTSLEDNVLDVENILNDINRLIHDTNSSDGFDYLWSRLLVSLCRALHPLLVSTFLDCAPSVFSPTQASPEMELAMIHALLEIARCLYGCLLRGTDISQDDAEAVRKDLEAFMTRLSAYFPFGEDTMFASDIKSEDVFRQMNLIYCELFSLRSLNHHSSTREHDTNVMRKRRKLCHPQSDKAERPIMTDANNARKTERVREYVVRCLRGTSSVASMSTHPLGQSLTAQTYIELLPTLWWLLNRDDEHVDEVLEAVLQHATKAGSTTAVKLVAIEFVGRLILMQTEPTYIGSFKVGSSMPQELQKLFRDWLYHLPKVLWELGDRNPDATEMILLFILRLSQRRSWLIHNETTVALCTRYAPFFTIQHGTRELRGPYARLDDMKSTTTFPEGPGPKKPSSLKKLALDVAAVLVSATCQAHLRSAPRKKFLGTDHIRADGTNTGRLTKLGSGPVLEMGSSASLASMVEAQTVLRVAIGKAVSGTTEESYWLGVSHL